MAADARRRRSPGADMALLEKVCLVERTLAGRHPVRGQMAQVAV